MAFFFYNLTMPDLDDPLLFLRQDYLRLMLTYQLIEDYLFQAVYGYLRYGHNKEAGELNNFKSKSLSELKDFFFTTFQVRGLSKEEKQELSKQFGRTISKRNYYAHEFFSDLYLKIYDEATQTFDPERLEDIDYELHEENEDASAYYEKLVAKFGPHVRLAPRGFPLSPRSSSLTHNELSKEFQTPAYAAQREEAFVKSYWNLCYGYFVTEASLYAIVSKLQTRYHFLDKGNAESLEGKSLNEYRKLLILAIKKDPIIHMTVDDCLSDMSTFAKDITALQQERNYWLHFCVLEWVKKEKSFDFSAYCSNVENYNKLSKSLLFCEKTKQKVFALEDSLTKRLG